MITIIIPVYKVEKYLRQCIDSILAQTYTDWELLLIDDGSPDGSGSICDEYAAKDTRIRVFHKTNGGVSSARNLGLDNANGEYVTFVDADDWLAPNAYQLCSEELCKNEVDILQFNFANIVSGRFNYICRYDSSPILNNEQVVKNNLLLGTIWCCLFKKEILDRYNIRQHEDLWKAEDSLFLYEFLYRAETFKHIDHTLYYYRNNETSASHRPDESQNLVLRTEYKIVLSEQWAAIKPRFDLYITFNLLHLITFGDTPEPVISDLFRRAKIKYYSTYYTFIARINPRFAYKVTKIVEPYYAPIRSFHRRYRNKIKNRINRLFNN